MELHLSGLCLLLLVSPLAGWAEDDAASETAARAAEIEATEPGVATDGPIAEPARAKPAVPVSDIRRSTVGNQVMDEMDLGRTEITGNQELPKVLYIVPWKKADPGDLLGRPVNSLLDEVLAPIDRSEFIRQVDFYNDLKSEQNK